MIAAIRLSPFIDFDAITLIAFAITPCRIIAAIFDFQPLRY
jgi:hypothetical protein